MSGVNVARVITIDTTSVVIERLWHCNTASNWTSLIDFLHHVVLTVDKVVFIDTVDAVLVRNKASFSWVAVTAYLHCTALLAIVVATRPVNRASLISDLVVSHPLEGIQMPSTVTAIICHLARDENLW